MAESLKRETKCVYVDTSLDTHLLVLVHDSETISDFKVKLCKEHLQCFPKLGEIDIAAVKVNRPNTSGLLLDYHMPDSTLLSMVLEGIGHNCWSVYVDAAVKVEKCELPSENGLNLELLLHEKDKNDSLLLDGHTNNHSLEKDLEAGVTEKTAKKRKVKDSDGQKKRKKPKVDRNQSSAAAITASQFDVDQSREFCRNVQLEVVATESSSPREKLDDTLPETTTKETEMGGKSVEDVGRVNIETDNLLDMTSCELTTWPDTENKKKRKKKRSKDDINQSSAAAVTTSNAESVALATPPESLPASGEEKRELEKSVEAEGIETHQLDTSSGLTASRPDTEKKETRKKISEDDTNQISAIANVEEGVDATPPASLPISRGENLYDSFAVVASRKENELVKISIVDVGRDQIETDNLVSHTENHKETVSEVTTRPDTEKKKKKRRKKRSKYGISQSFPASVATSRDIVNEIEGVPIKAVEGEEPDNVVEEKNETEENNASLEVAGSEELSVEVNNTSLEVAQSHELLDEVNTAALEDAPLMNNPQDTESDALLLRKCSEVADDDVEDKSLSKKILKEKADRGDNSGCSQNQEKPDQVAGGAKSNEGLDLHPSGSSTDHFMSGKLFFLASYGNNLDGGTNKFSGSLQDILRR